MTDAQFYVLTAIVGSGLATIAVAIRWSVGIIVKSLDKNSEAMMKNTESNAKLSTKIDGISEFVERATLRSEDTTPPLGNPTGYYSKKKER